MDLDHFRGPVAVGLLLPRRWRTLPTYRSLVLGLTFLAYTGYHLSRRPFSIVKNVLNRNCTALDPQRSYNGLDGSRSTTWCDWAPFDTENANALLATLDSCFLVTYAIGMFVSGFVADRCNLRYFLALGMLLSGLLTYALGLAYYYDIHSLAFFVIVQILSGFFQTTGWPAVVACVGHWFSKSSRGLIFGLWNAHTSVGNIAGALIAGAFVESNWGLSFIVPGVIMGATGFLLFLFLTPYPEEVNISSAEIHPEDGHDGAGGKHLSGQRTRAAVEGLTGIESSSESTSSLLNSSSQEVESNRQQHQQQQPQQQRRKRYTEDELTESSVHHQQHQRHHHQANLEEGDEESPLLLPQADDRPINASASSVGGGGGGGGGGHTKSAISFVSALKIPGVIEFSVCLFFAKFVSYTFLYWLPRIIKDTTGESSSNSAYLSVPFDLGGMLGGVLAGYVVDRTGASAITCVVMLLLAIPSLYAYLLYGALSNWTNMALQVVAGTFVNGPYALITTAVSAELGTKVKSSQALATVTAIIDGTGSLGAAVGPFFAGLFSGNGSWSNVFFMVMLSDALALLSLLRIARQEWARIRSTSRSQQASVTDVPV